MVVVCAGVFGACRTARSTLSARIDRWVDTQVFDCVCMQAMAGRVLVGVGVGLGLAIDPLYIR